MRDTPEIDRLTRARWAAGEQGGSSLARSLVLALGAGGLHALSMPPGAFGWAVPGVVGLSFCSLRRVRNGGHAFGLGVIYGLSVHLGVFHWLFEIPETPAAILAVGYLALSVMGAIFPGLLFFVFARVGGRLPVGWGAALFAVLWVGMEQLRGFGLLGFPWLDLSTSLAVHPLLIQVAAWGGAAAVDLMAAGVGVALALAIDPRGCSGRRLRFDAAGVAMLILGAWVAVGWLRLPSIGAEPETGGSDSLRVAVVQGNIDPTEKWLSGHARLSLETFAEETRTEMEAAEGAIDLFVWPETSLPCLVEGESAVYCRSWVEELARETGAWLLVGALAPGPQVGGRKSYYNSAYLVDPAGEWLDRYDKVHLVPFGEMIPLDDQIEVLRRVDFGEGDFVAGEAVRPIGDPPRRLGVLICFESLFGGQARSLARAGARLLVVMTNDAWFGRSAAPEQHAAIAALRAVETGLPVARCANTGISGFVDPWGRYSVRIELDERGTRVATLPAVESDTLYSRWGEIVGFPSGLLFVALALGELLGRRRKGSN
ncbi:MAG: apolipoprotein N-acyltransferase [Gemmatimonadetes bacterium]|nr:apolipoprotein N-acyltransferase [Gemmatimonadota bacterium]